MMLQNKTIFITGASSGIGAACAKQFAQLRTRLLLCARNSEKLNKIATNLEQEYGVETYTFPLDIRYLDKVRFALKSLPAQWQTVVA